MSLAETAAAALALFTLFWVLIALFEVAGELRHTGDALRQLSTVARLLAAGLAAHLAAQERATRELKTTEDAPGDDAGRRFACDGCSRLVRPRADGTCPLCGQGVFAGH